MEARQSGTNIGSTEQCRRRPYGAAQMEVEQQKEIVQSSAFGGSSEGRWRWYTEAPMEDVQNRADDGRTEKY